MDSGDTTPRFSLRAMLVIPVVYSVALLFWKVSPLHGVIGLVTATALSAAILLANPKNQASLALKFFLTLAFAMLALIVFAEIMSNTGNRRYARDWFLFVIAGGGFLGWRIAHSLTRRRDRSNA